jgi:hypothetical protein
MRKKNRKNEIEYLIPIKMIQHKIMEKIIKQEVSKSGKNVTLKKIVLNSNSLETILT